MKSNRDQIRQKGPAFWLDERHLPIQIDGLEISALGIQNGHSAESFFFLLLLKANGLQIFDGVHY